MSQHILYSLSHSHTHRDFNIISFVWNCELKHDLFSTSWSRRLYDSTHQKTPRDGVTNRSYRHAGNEIVLLKAYSLHVCSLRCSFSSFPVLYICWRLIPACFVSGEVTLQRPGRELWSVLVRWVCCLSPCVFGWKWCHYACSPPLSVTLTKHGPLRRSRWHDRCVAAACAGRQWLKTRLAAGPVSFLRLSMRTALFYGPCVILSSKQGKNVLSISYVGIVFVYYIDSSMLSKSMLGKSLNFIRSLVALCAQCSSGKRKWV